MASALAINLDKVSRFANGALIVGLFLFAGLGHFFSFYFHFLTVALFFGNLLNFYYRFGQTEHALLRNFGILAQARYLTESIGPEMRQYLFAGDLTEKPFNRLERAEVYQKAKGIDSSSAFGSQLSFGSGELKLRHSMYPVESSQIGPFVLRFGGQRGILNVFTLRFPVMISAMSYGALSSNAVRALARGARLSGVAMNTGEGGFPKYHLEEGCDLIFQMGTAKFGVRDDRGGLDDHLLADLAARPEIKMIEIKLSQGAKPGKGGLLPKEKITPEIADLRRVPLGMDVVSPPSHLECVDAASTVAFIRRVQQVSGLPVGIKMCLGRPAELFDLALEVKRQGVCPDYISIDGAEGGTGAAPRAFMDDLGLPLFHSLPLAHRVLRETGVRDQVHLLGAGKLINPSRQIMAMSFGADAVYTARGFMLSLGCIQALQCNANTCPVGITTHQPSLTKGLDIESKAHRVKNYVAGLRHDHLEILGALGCRNYSALGEGNLYLSDQPSTEVLPPATQLMSLHTSRSDASLEEQS